MSVTELYRKPSDWGKEQGTSKAAVEGWGWVVLKENLQGKGPEYVFANAGVEMILTEAETVNLALQALRCKAE